MLYLLHFCEGKQTFLFFTNCNRTFVAMQLRKLKGIISWFFVALLTLGMADFSLHALSHKHAQSHQLEHADCTHGGEHQDGVQTIFSAEEDCLICGHFVIHTMAAVADLGTLPSHDLSATKVLFTDNQLISNKLPSFFLRGPPEV